MAAYNFPSNPSDGDTVTVNGVTYSYSSSKTRWQALDNRIHRFSVSETAPSGPSTGDFWFDPNVLKTYVYYNDGSSNQWVQANPAGGGEETSTVSVSDTAPSSPGAGQLWWNSTANKLYIYYTDANSSQWVQATTPGGTGSTGATGATGAAGADGPPAGRNKIMNGNFDVWQRGTSFTATGYTSDRWHLSNIGTTSTFTQQQFALGQTDVPDNPTNYMRGVVSSVTGAGNACILKQKIEYVRTFQGQTVTLSFYAKADAVKNIAVELYQDFGTSGSPSSGVYVTPQKFALSTTWTKYTKTFTIPSITGKTLGTDSNDYLQLNFWLDAGSDFNSRTDTLGQQSGTFEFAQVQLEEGSSATDFEYKSIGETIQDCKRYYVHLQRVGGAGYATGSGQTARAMTTCTFPVAMRAIPTITTVINSQGSISSVQGNNVASASCLFGGTSSASGSIWYKATATLDAEL